MRESRGNEKVREWSGGHLYTCVVSLTYLDVDVAAVAVGGICGQDTDGVDNLSWYHHPLRIQDRRNRIASR